MSQIDARGEIDHQHMGDVAEKAHIYMMQETLYYYPVPLNNIRPHLQK
jgi:hypothetical protein